jgi:hypothetical protein
MKRISVLFGRYEFHILVFCVSLILFSWPLVSSLDFDRINALFVYLFVSWSIVVFLQFLISRVLIRGSSSQSTDESE